MYFTSRGANSQNFGQNTGFKSIRIRYFYEPPEKQCMNGLCIVRNLKRNVTFFEEFCCRRFNYFDKQHNFDLLCSVQISHTHTRTHTHSVKIKDDLEKKTVLVVIIINRWKTRPPEGKSHNIHRENSCSEFYTRWIVRSHCVVPRRHMLECQF